MHVSHPFGGRILIADLRVNSRAEILPTYRVGAPVVCAQTSSVVRRYVGASVEAVAGWAYTVRHGHRPLRGPLRVKAHGRA